MPDNRVTNTLLSTCSNPCPLLDNHLRDGPCPCPYSSFPLSILALVPVLILELILAFVLARLFEVTQVQQDALEVCLWLLRSLLEVLRHKAVLNIVRVPLAYSSSSLSCRCKLTRDR